MSMPAPVFPPATLAFLRALKRNNDREWFRARKDRYERDVRAPTIGVIERLARDFRTFAPELEASPKASLYRIYRDTRFSADKTPLKTTVSAVFPWKGAPRHEGAGLYFEISPGWVWMGGGLYAPDTPELVRVRERIATSWPRLQRIVRAKAFVDAIGQLSGERLTRVPRGYPPDHPAAEYLRYKQFLAGRELPPDAALSAGFYPELVATFKAIMPLVRFLNGG